MLCNVKGQAEHLGLMTALCPAEAEQWKGSRGAY